MSMVYSLKKLEEEYSCKACNLSEKIFNSEKDKETPKSKIITLNTINEFNVTDYIKEYYESKDLFISSFTLGFLTAIILAKNAESNKIIEELTNMSYPKEYILQTWNDLKEEKEKILPLVVYEYPINILISLIVIFSSFFDRPFYLSSDVIEEISKTIFIVILK